MKTIARSLLSMMITSGLVTAAFAQPAAQAPAKPAAAPAAAPAAKAAPAAAPAAPAAPAAKTAPAAAPTAKAAPAAPPTPAATKPAPAAKPVAPTAAPTPVKADPAKPVAPGEPAAPPAMPVAPTEVAAMVKAAPSLRCTGSVFSPMGETKMTATIKNKVDLDKWWVHTSFVQNGGMKFKFESFTTYDAGSKKWHRVMMDNFGTYEVATSSGPKDGKLVWDGTSTSAMGTMMGRHTEDMTNPKETKMEGEFSMDKNKSWMKAYSLICKR